MAIRSKQFHQVKLAHRSTGDGAPLAPAVIESAVHRVRTGAVKIRTARLWIENPKSA
jgi:hypothetical protein